jgi:alkylhydroperoxidase family enzyme
LNYGLDSPEDTVGALLNEGVDAVEEPRLRALLDYALKVNMDAASVTDADVEALRGAGLKDLGIVQITHIVSDFGAYNRLNLALDTDYDYRSFWQQLAFPSSH